MKGSDQFQPGEKTRGDWLWTLFWVALAAVIFAPQIFGRELMPPDEPRFALVGRAMFESGDWVVQRRGGEIYMDKPPLLFWGQAAAFHFLGGPGEEAARLPCLAATLLLTAGLFRTFRRWAGAPLAGRAVAVFLTLSLVLQRGAWVATDALLAAAVFLALGALDKAALGRPKDEAIAGALCALGVLAKGPVALVFLLLAAGAAWTAHRLIRGAGPPLFSLAPLLRPAAWISGLIILLPWPLMLSLRLGPRTLWEALWKHNALRFAHSWDNLEPWWYHGPTLLLGLFPWTILFLAAFAPPVFKTFRTDRRLVWLLVLCGGALIFFSIPHGKRSVYLLPVYPALAFVMASVLPRLALGKIRFLLAPVHAVLGLATGLAAAGIREGMWLPAEIGQLAEVRRGAAALLLLASLALFLMAWGLATGRAGRVLAGPLALAVGSGLLFPALFTPAINAAQGARPFAAAAGPLIPPGAKVAFTRTKWELMSWYTGLEAPWLSKPARVTEFLAQSPPRLVIGACRELPPPSAWPPGTAPLATLRLGREEFTLLRGPADDGTGRLGHP